MNGPDCERILSGICSIKDEVINSIISLSTLLSTFQVTSETDHVHPSNSYGYVTNGSHKDYHEKKVSYSTSAYISKIIESAEKIVDDGTKMDNLEQTMYVNSSEYNNSYGSPWTEIQKMQSILEVLKTYKGTLQYIGDIIGLISLLNAVESCAIDAKWALIIYHDPIQRGYDYNYNDKNPSYPSTKADGTLTTGNVSQSFDENVHIKEPILDPF